MNSVWARSVTALVPLALAWALGAPPALALSNALFDFNDFPDPSSGITTAYGCDGKSFCTAQEVLDIGAGAGLFSGSLSTTRNGITASFSNLSAVFGPGGGVTEVWPPGGTDKFLGPGNDDALFRWVVDFDMDLGFVQLDLPSPVAAGAFTDQAPAFHTSLELWSGPGGTGDLVANVILTSPTTGLNFALSSRTPFRSFVAGRFDADNPTCVGIPTATCPGLGAISNLSGSLDNIFVKAIPEPTAALLFGIGLGVVGIATKRRRLN